MYSPSQSTRCVASTVVKSMRRRLSVRSRVLALSDGFFGSGSAPIARAAMRSAAEMYFSISTGEIVSTSPMLSKP